MQGVEYVDTVQRTPALLSLSLQLQPHRERSALHGLPQAEVGETALSARWLETEDR